MKLILSLFLITVVCFAQPEKSNLIYGLTNTDVYLGNEFSGCRIKIEEIVHNKQLLLVYDQYNCGGVEREQFYKVVYNGKKYFINKKDLTVDPQDIYKLNSLDSIGKINILKESEKMSIEIEEFNKKKIQKYVDAGKLSGLLIKKSYVFNESKYVEGIGFYWQVFNSSSKIIKYIWVTVDGYNDVGDSEGIITLKCIGPINKNDDSEYEFNFAWKHDLVSSFKIKTIKIQYMDGTFKTISNTDNIIVPEEYHASVFKKDYLGR